MVASIQSLRGAFLLTTIRDWYRTAGLKSNKKESLMRLNLLTGKSDRQRKSKLKKTEKISTRKKQRFKD
jgi:hypothetical protein